MVLKSLKSFLTVVKESHSEKQWTDVNIRFAGESHPCHKFVLGAQSHVLHEVFLNSETGAEVETLIFDGAFDNSDVQEFISYIYGVTTNIPHKFSFLFPSHLQVKPDIKPEHLEEVPQVIRNTHFGGLWDVDDWQDEGKNEFGNNHSNSYDYDNGDGFDRDYGYDKDDSFIDDDDYDDDYTRPNGKRKKYKKVKLEGGEKSECQYCGKFVNKLPKHVFSTHKEMWEEFNKDRPAQNRKKNYPKQCPHCPKMLSCNWHYERHIKTHMEPKERKVKKEKDPEETGSFVCTQCGEEFQTKKAMKTHEYKHKNEVACDFKDCNEIFLSHLAYANHMLFKHQRVIKRRKCHAKVKTGNENEEDKKKEMAEKKHLCTECGRGFREADSLKKHVIFVHTERAIPSHICNVCGKKFKTSNKLKNHMLLHEPPTLPCPFCDKLFETDHKVKKHIKSTHVEDDQKLYQCSYCQKGFSHFPSFESHMNSHKNIRPYQCHLCDNAYQNHFNLQQHVKKNHGVLISSNHNA